MTEAVIRRLRRLQGLGIVTPAHCIRAERYVQRYPEIFSAAAGMTVSQAADLAKTRAVRALRTQRRSHESARGTRWRGENSRR
jgi:predicted metallo-beta-lactamase superfamily hydrolase